MIAVVVVMWLLLGSACAFVLVRRGHGAVWFVLVFLGPLLPLLALSEVDTRPPDLPRAVPGEAGRGEVDVLVGVDGSAASSTAAEGAITLLGERLGRLTLASVIDMDSASWPDLPTGARSRAEQLLAEEASAVGDLLGRRVGTVLLAGEPSEALKRRAVDDGAALIVVGSTGKGATTALVGSVARHLASSSSVPVLVVPPKQ